MTKDEVIRSAENGNTAAMIQLIAYYVSNEVNLSEAKKWAERAENTNDIRAIGAAANLFHIKAHVSKKIGALEDAEFFYFKSLDCISKIKKMGGNYEKEAEVHEGLAELYCVLWNRRQDALQELELIKDSDRPYAALMIQACHSQMKDTDMEILKEDIFRIRKTIDNEGWPSLSLKATAYSIVAAYYVAEKDPQMACYYFRNSAEVWDCFIGEVKEPISADMSVSEMKKIYDKTDFYYTQYMDIQKQIQCIKNRNRGKNRISSDLTGGQWGGVIAGFFMGMWPALVLYLYFKKKNEAETFRQDDGEMIKNLGELSEEMLEKGKNTGIAVLIPESQLRPEIFTGIYEDFKKRNRDLYE